MNELSYIVVGVRVGASQIGLKLLLWTVERLWRSRGTINERRVLKIIKNRTLNSFFKDVNKSRYKLLGKGRKEEKMDWEALKMKK